MSCITQNQMTKEGREQMFAAWAANAPGKPAQGWFGSLISCADEHGQYYHAPIEDYNDDGAIVQIGSARLALPGMEYSETIYP